MDAETSLVLTGMEGKQIDVVLYTDGNTRLVTSTIETLSPLSLRVVGECNSDLRPGRRVMLLGHLDGTVLRADAHLDQVRTDADSLVLNISNVQWEFVERRRHVRVPVRFAVTMRLVNHEGEVAETQEWTGWTVDLSVSGAFVRTNDPPAEGSLIEFETVLDGEEVTTLAVVARVTADGNGVGIHFVEYLANAKSLLGSYLADAA